MPLVSVLLPTHNHASTLSLAIECLKRQTLKDIEILVVGDGCDRQTAAIAEAADDSRISFFDLPKAAGVGYANRNRVLKEAKGDIIAYATDDDLIFPNHLESLVGAMKRDQIKWAYARPLYVTVDGHILPEYINLKMHRERKLFLEVSNMLPSGAICHRRSCLDDVGNWSEDLAREGDWDLWRRIIAHYGSSAIGFSRLPTVMHFSTTTRSEEAAKLWPRPLLYLRGVATYSSSWPRALKVEVADAAASTLQQVVFAALQQDRSYGSKIADAVQRLQDHIVWAACRNQTFS